MRIITFFLLACVSILSWSQESGTHSGSDYPLLNFEISSHQLSSAFSAFIYFEGGDKHLRNINQALTNTEAQLQALTIKNAGLEKAWADAKAHVERYEGHVFNGFDMSLEGGWSLVQNAMQAEILALKQTNPVSDEAKQGQIYLLLSFRLSLEELLAQYMSIANSTTGGYGVSRGELSIEDRVAMTEDLLQKLKSSGANVDAINRKWQYIKKTILAYNSNIAPFVVIHTVDTIRKQSARLIADAD